MEEKLKKIDEEKKSKEKNKDPKKALKENFTNLPQDKFEKVKKEKLNDSIGRKIVNKLGQTQNLEQLLNKKDKKTKDDNKPPKPKRDMEDFLKKQAEIKDQFKKYRNKLKEDQRSQSQEKVVKSERLRDLNLKSRELLSSCKKRSASERNNKTNSFVHDESKVDLDKTKEQEDLSMFKDYIDNFMKGCQDDYDIAMQNKKEKVKREASEENREKILSKIPAVTRLRERVDKVTCMNPRDRELEQRATLMPEV